MIEQIQLKLSLFARNHRLALWVLLYKLYNRIALLVGYQPLSVTVSLEHYNARKLYSARPGGSEHIRFFTSRALVDLLRCHQFKIRHVKGAYVSASYYLPRNSWLSSLVLLGEKLFAKFPSLATITIVEAEK